MAKSRQDGTRPHVLWVNQFAVTPADGGGTRHYELAKELVRRGWRVTVAASDFDLHRRVYRRRGGADDRSAIREVVDGVEFLWLWSAPYTRNDWRRVHNWLSFATSLTRGVAGDRPDAVIGSSPQLFAALAASEVARRARVPFVLEVRDLWPESLEAIGGSRGALYVAFAAVARLLYRRSRRTIVLTRGVGDYLVRRGWVRGAPVYVPNGIDPSSFPPRAARDPLAADDALTLVYAGAHGPANGLDTVLEAAALLADEPRVRVLLVGDGPAKPALVAQAAALGLRNVEFRDPVSKREMPSVFAGADAGLMVLRPAELFTFGVSPNKLFDYCGASLPVVCNVRGEVAAMVAEAGAGEQAADATPAALADAVRRLLRRPAAERAAMGARGREWVEQAHSRPVLAARVEDVLREVLA